MEYPPPLIEYTKQTLFNLSNFNTGESSTYASLYQNNYFTAINTFAYHPIRSLLGILIGIFYFNNDGDIKANDIECNDIECNKITANEFITDHHTSDYSLVNESIACHQFISSSIKTNTLKCDTIICDSIIETKPVYIYTDTQSIPIYKSISVIDGKIYGNFDISSIQSICIFPNYTIQFKSTNYRQFHYKNETNEPVYQSITFNSQESITNINIFHNNKKI